MERAIPFGWPSIIRECHSILPWLFLLVSYWLVWHNGKHPQFHSLLKISGNSNRKFWSNGKYQESPVALATVEYSGSFTLLHFLKGTQTYALLIQFFVSVTSFNEKVEVLLK